MRSGKFAFGSADGFVLFDPDDLNTADHLSKVTITDMYLDYKPVSSDAFEGNVDLKDQITLEFKENSFGFSFAVLDSSYPALLSKPTPSSVTSTT